MNPLYRALVSLSVVLPLGIVLVFSYIKEICLFFQSMFSGRCVDKYCVPELPLYFFEIVVIACVLAVTYLLGLGMKEIILKMRDERTPEPIKFLNCKRLGMNSITDFLPYVLLLIFAQNEILGLYSCIVALLMLFCLAFVSPVINYSPLLELTGLKFYEAEKAAGEIVVVLTEGEVPPMKQGVEAIRISHCCFLLCRSE